MREAIEARDWFSSSILEDVMALITCPECAHQVSTEAEVCPQCGYPIGRTTEKSVGPAGPKCYACSAMATTRCAACNCFSCAEHLKWVGEGPRRALLCNKCTAAAQKRDEIAVVMLFVLLPVFMGGVLLLIWLAKSR